MNNSIYFTLFTYDLAVAKNSKLLLILPDLIIMAVTKNISFSDSVRKVVNIQK